MCTKNAGSFLPITQELRTEPCSPGSKCWADTCCYLALAARWSDPDSPSTRSVKVLGENGPLLKRSLCDVHSESDVLAVQG